MNELLRSDKKPWIRSAGFLQHSMHNLVWMDLTAPHESLLRAPALNITVDSSILMLSTSTGWKQTQLCH